MKQLLVILSSFILLISCNDKSGNNTADANDKADSSKAEKMESKEDRNKKIIKESMAAMNDHNIDKLVSMMTPDAVDYGDGTEAPAKHSADSIKASMNQFFTAFPDFKGSDLKYYADGDHVVVIGEYSGTFKKDMGKMKATNKSFKFMDADIFTLNDDGKITSHRYIQPNSTMFRQIAADKKK